MAAHRPTCGTRQGRAALATRSALGRRCLKVGTNGLTSTFSTLRNSTSNHAALSIAPADKA